jgi:hypothetical protein
MEVIRLSGYTGYEKLEMVYAPAKPLAVSNQLGMSWAISGRVGIFHAMACWSLFLPGCSSIARQSAPMLDSAGKTREASALDGVKRLREAFNQGACQSIFSEADPVFRLRQSPQDWLNECQRMRRELGRWQSFQAKLQHSPGIPLRVVVYGEGRFSRGRRHLETVWHFDRGRAELFSLYLDGTRVPPSPFRPRDRYMDPPPKGNREKV